MDIRAVKSMRKVIGYTAHSHSMSTDLCRTKMEAREALMDMIAKRLELVQIPTIVNVLREYHVVQSYDPCTDGYCTLIIWPDGRTSCTMSPDDDMLSAVRHILKTADATLTEKVCEATRIFNNPIREELHQELRTDYLMTLRYQYAKNQVHLEHEAALAFAWAREMTVRTLEIQIAEAGWRTFVRELLDAMHSPNARFDPTGIATLKRELG